MPLSATTMKATIKSELEAVIPGLLDADRLDDFCTAIANAVVTRITADAVVTTVTTTVVASGSSAGTYPGTGTGTVA